MKTMQQNKKGQVTIFIILAILIVAGILVYIFYVQPTYLNPNSASLKIETCVSDAINGAISELAINGGFAEPSFGYKYQDANIPYLCYTSEYYKTCTVQAPFPEKLFQKNLVEMTKDQIDACYTNSISDLRNKGYDVSSAVPNFSMELQPDKIVTTFGGEITITRDSSQTLGELKVETPSTIYNTLMIATSILQQEVQYGDSDTTYIMQLYPDFIIDKLKQGDETTIYIIQDKTSKIKYQFASRSLAWPPGYGISK